MSRSIRGSGPPRVRDQIFRDPRLPNSAFTAAQMREAARGGLVLSVQLGPVRELRIFKSATASDADAAHSFSIRYRERLI
jgi:hypothetical protein